MSVGARSKMFSSVLHPSPDQDGYILLLRERWDDRGLWDFYRASDWADWSANCPLNTTFYVSPSSSIEIDTTAAAGDYYALCKLASTLNLKAGKIIVWRRYQLLGVGRPYFYIGVTGAGSTGLQFDMLTGGAGAWSRWVLIWYQGKNGVGDDKTFAGQDQWPEGEDEPVPAVLEYSPMTGSTNRLGVGAGAQSLGRLKYYDDTEIYAKV